MSRIHISGKGCSLARFAQAQAELRYHRPLLHTRQFSGFKRYLAGYAINITDQGKQPLPGSNDKLTFSSCSTEYKRWLDPEPQRPKIAGNRKL